MIQDKQTNFLYLADCLPKKYPSLYKELENTLSECLIRHELLPQTKDVWAIDYMPIQLQKDRFVQFVYKPDYLRNSIRWVKTITEVDRVCKEINLSPRKSNILLDGGNLIKAESMVIMTDKVFTENPHYSERKLIKELYELLEVEKIIFIPTDNGDFTGHADGMVRFFDSTTVLINDYSTEDKELQSHLQLALHNAGLDYIEIPYNPYQNYSVDHANGTYLNYLRMQQALILPVYGMKEDEKVVRQFEQLFKGELIQTVDASLLARDGGVLNCISWSILK